MTTTLMVTFFVLYGGNGSLVPPKVTLAKSLAGDRPTLLVFTWTTAAIASNMPPWFRGYRRSMVG